MKTINKKLFILFFLGLISVFLGSLIKLSGNSNATMMITVGLILNIVSILGLFIFNLKKLIQFFE